MDVMLALGEYRFSTATAAYGELTRATEYRWEAIDRHAGKQALQFAGHGADTIRVSGTIYPHYRGGLAQLPALRVTAEQGEPLLLVDGLGIQHGLFVIERVSETQTHIDGEGVASRIDFELGLKAYGDGL